MKRIMAFVLAAIAAVTLIGCAKAPAEPVKVGTLMGPTGMGMAKLMDETDKYAVTLSAAPDEITGAFISGDIDIACVPVNLASVLFNKLEGDVIMLAVNTLGVLYVVENGDSINSIADLSGKTLYATGQGATPEYILAYLLEKNGVSDVTVEYQAEHAALSAMLAEGQADIGMLPEPNVTATLVKNDALRIALDMTEEWSKVSDTQLVQGCVIAKKSWYDENKEAASTFMDDYKASVEFVNGSVDEAAALIAQHGIVAAEAVAKKALPNCNIVFITGEDMKASASAMLEVLFAANPKSVGGMLPGDELYLVD